MENKPARFKIGINFGISTAFIMMVALTTLGICLVVFINMQQIMRDDLRKQLHNTAMAGALLIDGSSHDSLTDPAQESGPQYLEIKAKLIALKAGVAEIRYVYTMRLNDQGGVEFVVDAETDPDSVSHIGDIYDSPTPELLTALKTGVATAESGFTSDEWGTWLSGFAPIRDSDGRQTGILGIDMSADTIRQNEAKTLGLLVLVAILVGIVVLVLGFILSRRITTPLKMLEQDMIRIENFDIDGQLEIHSLFREISSIASTIEDVKDSLRSFRKYVPADLVAQLITAHKQAALGGERKDLTIFFSDIENFTTWSENLDPEELIGIMARYFSGMTEIIHRHHGTVDKYIGDAIMAFWGAPLELEDHAFHACNAALECLEFQASLNAELATEGLAEINTRIGLNSGEVLVGNVGYDQRLNYTVLGDHVNIASRLEGLNKYYETNIIVAANTAGRVEGRFVFRCLDKVVVKGRSRQIQIFELCSRAGKTMPGASENRFAELSNQAADLYFNRQWPEALTIFERLLQERPADKPVRIMLDRCRELIATDPGPDWQGYIILRDK